MKHTGHIKAYILVFWAEQSLAEQCEAVYNCARDAKRRGDELEIPLLEYRAALWPETYEERLKVFQR